VVEEPLAVLEVGGIEGRVLPTSATTFGMIEGQCEFVSTADLLTAVTNRLCVRREFHRSMYAA
jgi:hypothetical protein